VKKKAKYDRVLLKLTGEAFESKRHDLEPRAVNFIAKEIKSIYSMGVEIGIVVGGGNIARGDALVKNKYFHIEKSDADDIGMIATLANARYLKSALEDLDIQARVLSAIEIKTMAELFIRGRALKHLEKKRVTIFACGTGNPYLTTDTAAVIRANQIKADVILKCTHVDGIYSEDPEKNRKAKFLKTVTYEKVIKNRLRFMDFAALDMASREFKKPIIVFDIGKKGNLKRVICGKNVGSKVYHSVSRGY